jgi:hypothetical protein
MTMRAITTISSSRVVPVATTPAIPPLARIWRVVAEPADSLLAISTVSF